MAAIGQLDLEFLSLAFRGGGRLSAESVEAAGLGRIGTGRVMDELASLVERGLLAQEPGGGFAATGRARGLLWDEGVPLRERLLGLLEVGPSSPGDAAARLCAPAGEVAAGLEALRAGGLALMSTVRTARGPERSYEILPAGAGALRGEGPGGAAAGGRPELLGLLDGVLEAVAGEVGDAERARVAGLVGRARELLGGGPP